MNKVKQKQWTRSLRGEEPRVSFYRMIKGDDFAELCRFYEQGIGVRSFSRYEELAKQLERTYCP